MTKEQMKNELAAKNAELEQLKKEKAELARCFSAVTSAKRNALNERECAEGMEDPENLHAVAFHEGAAHILSRLFLFDDNGECIGFNLDEVAYYCWLAQDPRRKSA